MCLTQEACLRRNLVHVCPNPARKNSESSPQQRERGPSTKVCFHTAEPWGKWGARGPRDDCGLSGFFPRLAYMFSLTPGMRQKGTVQVPSSFFYEHQSIIHQSEALHSDGPASSSVWHGNTICSVSYCIHHCSMRELWETSTLSKNWTEDVQSWAGFQALLIFPSVSLWYEALLNNCMANSTSDASREIYMFGLFTLPVCLEWCCMSPTPKTESTCCH